MTKLALSFGPGTIGFGLILLSTPTPHRSRAARTTMCSSGGVVHRDLAGRVRKATGEQSSNKHSHSGRGARRDSTLDTPMRARRCTRGQVSDNLWRWSSAPRASAPPARRRSSLFRARNGTAAVARTPVLPEATLIGSLSAQLRRPRPRSATSAILKGFGRRPFRPYLVVPVPQGCGGTLTPIIASRVTNFASRSSSHPSVPAGRRGNTR